MGVAHASNIKVEMVREKNQLYGASDTKQKELDRLSKVVGKQQKVVEFIKLKNEDAQYFSEQRG